MLKPILDFSKQIFALNRDLQQCKADVADLRAHNKEQDDLIKDLIRAVDRLALRAEYDRETRDRDRADTQRDQENLVLRLENALMRAGIGLPPGSAQKKTDEEPDA
jgi:predicted RNase H-like nuclease (RuvC/YqgF family)